jgi:hypothetical protein
VEGSLNEKDAEENKKNIETLKPLIDIPIRYIPYEFGSKLGALRNRGNNACKGDITVCMDDDDYYFPERIEHAVKKLTSSSCKIAGCSAILIYDFVLNRTYKFRGFHANHSTNNAMAWKKEFIKNHQHDPEKEMAEEASFTKTFTEPMVQLESEKSVIICSHNGNTFNKRELLITGTLKMNQSLDELSLPQNLIPSDILSKYQEFYNLIIKRRILLESIKSLEMKNNGIRRNENNRLDNAIALIGKDKSLRKQGQKYGLTFTLDDKIKEVFILNLKLNNVNDTLIDLLKLIDEKLDLNTTDTPYQLGGGLKDYDFYIGNSLTQKGGSKNSVITHLNEIAEKYIELVTKIKEKENFILGLPGDTVFEELKEYIIDIDKIIKKIHVLNTRFTNINIENTGLDEISNKLDEIDNKYNKYAERLKVILKVSDEIFDDKLKIEERVIGGLPNTDVIIKKNELTAKMELLHDNLNYKIKHGLINESQVNKLLGGIDHLANIDTTYDLNQLGSYDNEIDEDEGF